MKYSKQICAALGLLALPVLSQAHPGHEGIPIHELFGVWVVLAVLCLFHRTAMAIRYITARRRRRSLHESGGCRE